MFTYTAKEIINHMYSHYKISEKSGMVVQVFGWGNGDSTEQLRMAIYDALGVKLAIATKHAKTTGLNLGKLTKTFFKTRSVKLAIEAGVDDEICAMKRVDEIKNLRRRIIKGLDIPDMNRPKHPIYATVTPALLDECRRYITVSLLNEDRKYDMDTPLIEWNTKANAYFKVEKDFSISTWRVGVAGYKNDVVGRDVQGIKVSYYVHNMEEDITRHQTAYNTETKNFERNWSAYTSGKWIPGSEIYYANIEDAVANAKVGLAKLEATTTKLVQAATDKLAGHPA